MSHFCHPEFYGGYYSVEKFVHPLSKIYLKFQTDHILMH